MILNEGELAPNFSLPDQEGKTHQLSDNRGHLVVLYFYPRDFTPGCTIEACSFRDAQEQFQKLDVAVLGISTDLISSHQKFAQKHQLNFPILSDEGTKVAQKYGVWKEKNILGKKFYGIERTTFIVDVDGKIMKVFPRVNPRGHDKQVLEFVKTLI